jgi:putative glycosyltransferase (TIGR04372 family)
MEYSSQFTELSDSSTNSLKIGGNVIRVVDLLHYIIKLCGHNLYRYKYCYALLQSNRIGHTAIEPLIVCKRFGIDPKDLCILIPQERTVCNEFLLSCSARGACIVRIPEKICYLLYATRGAFLLKGLGFIGLGDEIIQEYMSYIYSGGDRVRLDDSQYFDDSHHMKFKQITGCTGPFVVVHNREEGWIKGAHHYLRNSNPITLIKAIRYLLKLGYRIIRVGDKSMTKLPDLLGLIDLPFIDGYAGWMDVYAISKCHFYLGTLSGPQTIAEMFDKPLLTHNAIGAPTNFGTNQVTLYKRFYSTEHKRDLSYVEFFSQETTDQASYFSTRQVQPFDCNEDDILDMVLSHIEESTDIGSRLDYLRTLNHHIDQVRSKKLLTPFFPASSGINVPTPVYLDRFPEFVRHESHHIN